MGMMQLFFLETSSLLRAFVEDNAHRKSASHSNLFRNFYIVRSVLIMAFVVKYY